MAEPKPYATVGRNIVANKRTVREWTMRSAQSHNFNPAYFAFIVIIWLIYSSQGTRGLGMSQAETTATNTWIQQVSDAGGAPVPGVRLFCSQSQAVTMPQ